MAKRQVVSGLEVKILCCECSGSWLFKEEKHEMCEGLFQEVASQKPENFGCDTPMTHSTKLRKNINCFKSFLGEGFWQEGN